MAFPLTLLYVAIALLSPGIFPVEISSLHINEVIGGLTLLACAFEVPASGAFRRTETYFMIGLIVASFASILVTGWIGGAVDFVVWFFPSAAPFFFVAISCRTLARLKILTFVLTAVAFFIIAHGIPGQMSSLATSPYVLCEFCESTTLTPILRSRGLGFLNDPNDLALFLVALIPLLWLRWKKGGYVGNVFLTLLPACALIGGVYLTHSRGGTMALGAVILFGFKDKLSIAGSVILAALGGAGALAIGASGGRGMTDDDGGRVGLWYDALQAFKSHPIFGVGARGFADYNHSLTAHNSYVLCLAEIGLFGYFFWSGVLVTGWDGLTARIRGFKSRQKLKAEEEQPAVAPTWASRYLAPVLKPAPVAAARLAVAGGPAQQVDMAAPGTASVTPLLYAPRTFGPVVAEEQVAYFARIFRISLVGSLVAAFFLSRTYSMSLYILLGMATALKGMGPQEGMQTNLLRLIGKIWVIIVLSIVLLSTFIRLRSH